MGSKCGAETRQSTSSQPRVTDRQRYVGDENELNRMADGLLGPLMELLRRKGHKLGKPGQRAALETIDEFQGNGSQVG
jgi:hypothetical protein